MIILVFLILVTATCVNGLDPQWPGIDLCHDDVDCTGRLMNSSTSNPENCSQFFLCVGQSLYPRSCDVGYLFDQNLMICLLAELYPTVHCQQPCGFGFDDYKQYIVYETTVQQTSSTTAVQSATPRSTTGTTPNREGSTSTSSLTSGATSSDSSSTLTSSTRSSSTTSLTSSDTSTGSPSSLATSSPSSRRVFLASDTSTALSSTRSDTPTTKLTTTSMRASTTSGSRSTSSPSVQSTSESSAVSSTTWTVTGTEQHSSPARTPSSPGLVSKTDTWYSTSGTSTVKVPTSVPLSSTAKPTTSTQPTSTTAPIWSYTSTTRMSDLDMSTRTTLGNVPNLMSTTTNRENRTSSNSPGYSEVTTTSSANYSYTNSSGPNDRQATSATIVSRTSTLNSNVYNQTTSPRVSASVSLYHDETTSRASSRHDETTSRTSVFDKTANSNYSTTVFKLTSSSAGEVITNVSNYTNGTGSTYGPSRSTTVGRKDDSTSFTMSRNSVSSTRMTSTVRSDDFKDLSMSSAPEDKITTTQATDISALCNRRNPCTPGDRFGDVIDCTKYFECVTFLQSQNFWMAMECPDGQVYAARTQSCVDRGPGPGPDEASGVCFGDICETKISHTIEMTPETAVSGSHVTLRCSFRILFMMQPVEVSDIYWQLNGYRLTSTGSGQRIQVGPTVLDNFVMWNSTLAFNPITTRDSGVIDCVVNYGNQQTSLHSTDNIRVLPTPSVDLYPLTAFVLKNQNVTLVCKAQFDESTKLYSYENDTGLLFQLNIVWFRQNEEIDFTNDTGFIVSGHNNVSIMVFKATTDVEIHCRANYAYGFSDSVSSSISIVQGDSSLCKSEIVGDIAWPQTMANSTSIVECGPSSRGLMNRKCVFNGTSAVWDSPTVDDCIDETLYNILSQVQDIGQGISVNNSNITETIAVTLRNYLSDLDTELTFGNFNTSLAILSGLGAVHEKSWDVTKPSNTEIKSVLWSTSCLLNSTNDELWTTLIKADEYGAVRLMGVVNVYGKKWSYNLSPGNSDAINYDYLSMSIMCEYQSSIQNLSFPEKYSPGSSDSDNDDDSGWMSSSIDNIRFQNPFQLQPENNETYYYISSSLYRNLNSHFPNASEIGHSSAFLGSRIISLTIDGLPSSHNLTVPVKIVLENIETVSDSVRRCVFWKSTNDDGGYWSEYGCRYNPDESDSKRTVCECNHLTNFAILVSPTPATGVSDVILSIISIIGCIVSLVSLCLAVLLFGLRWKKVRSHHFIVLINLCVALIVANVVFLSGVNRTGDKGGCTAVAALLHYFFLVAFCVMLVEGIQLLLYTTRPFYNHRTRDTLLLLLTAWVIPLIIVGVSLAVTRTEGYGNSISCWLSLKNGLLWAFVGPVLAIILVNITIMVIVVISIRRTKTASEETIRYRIWATVWNVCMITPVLGITWIFGVFSVNQDLVVFQYIFAIANSFQGFFIFLFHGLCYRKHSHSKTMVKQMARTYSKRPPVAPPSPDSPRPPPSGSRSMKARLEHHRRRLTRRQAVNWVAIAAAAVASSTDHLELQECDDDSSFQDGGSEENSRRHEGDHFSRSLRPTISNSSSSQSHTTTSTDRTDILF